jgi:hypothetical protein
VVLRLGWPDSGGRARVAGLAVADGGDGEVPHRRGGGGGEEGGPLAARQDVRQGPGPSEPVRSEGKGAGKVTESPT